MQLNYNYEILLYLFGQHHNAWIDVTPVTRWIQHGSRTNGSKNFLIFFKYVYTRLDFECYSILLAINSVLILFVF